MYGISLPQLRNLMELRADDAKNRIKELGGVEEICRYLNTNATTGLSGHPNDLESRKDTFGANVIEKKKKTPFLMLVWEAYQDVTLYILTGAAIVSFALPFCLEQEESEHPPWIEGVAIFACVILVLLVASITDYKKEKQFRDLQNTIDDGHHFTVFRKGEVFEIKVTEIVVGDICLVKYGDQLPADGIIIQSNDLKVDESSLTGESDHVKKGLKDDPMLLSGTNVMEGSGRMVVTAVGPNSQSGIIMTLLGNTEEVTKPKEEEENQGCSCCRKEKPAPRASVMVRGRETQRASILSRSSVMSNQYKRKSSIRFQGVPLPATGDDSEDPNEYDESDREKFKGKSVLQKKLTKLALIIGLVGVSMGLLIFLVLCIRFSIETFHVEGHEWKNKYWSIYLSNFIIGVTVLVVAIPEGLPLAVTLSLAYSVKKMMKDNNLVRHLHACETMGNATSICSDKTGTLTTNRMTVVQAFVCEKSYRKLPQYDDIPKNVAKLIVDGIAINTGYTSNIEQSAFPTDLPKQLGNKTECALLGFVLHLGKDYEEVRVAYPESNFFHVYTFNSDRKSMSTVVPLSGGGYRLYTKGAAEIILDKCKFCFSSNGSVIPFTDDIKTDQLENVIEVMASQGLRTISIAYKDFVTRVPNMNEVPYSSSINWEDEDFIVSKLTCICIVGIEDPVRPEVPYAIMQCQSAGISVRMVTGDNINTAKSIAIKCGILKHGTNDLILEGRQFNALIRDSKGNVRQFKFDKVWPRLKVLARSSPTDKYILVKGIIASKTLSQRQVVAVTGDGTNDGPALKVADVGFAMGIAGTDVAKEACDIILLDDNFNSIVKAVMWGRNVYDSIAKFLQFQLTVNAVALTVAFAGSCILQTSPLKATQMLWMNLIMDTLASLALSTEVPSLDLLNRKPYGRKQSLISGQMWKNIITQSIFQITVVFFFVFYAPTMMNCTTAIGRGHGKPPTQHFSMVFNVFVMMTLFNEINARKLHGERNVFKGLFTNYLFIIIWIPCFLLQVVIIEVGSYAFETARLDWDQWLVCIGFGSLTLIWYQLWCCIPLERMFEKHEECPPQIIITPLETNESALSKETDPPSPRKPEQESNRPAAAPNETYTRTSITSQPRSVPMTNRRPSPQLDDASSISDSFETAITMEEDERVDDDNKTPKK